MDHPDRGGRLLSTLTALADPDKRRGWVWARGEMHDFALTIMRARKVAVVATVLNFLYLSSFEREKLSLLLSLAHSPCVRSRPIQHALPTR